MKPLALTLKGFRGIRDGLGRDELVLDLEALAGGGQLVAIAGRNGRGKTTVMDNLQPYLTMPSRATLAGPGGFSYYEHVYLPENEKELIWTHEGRRYKSQIVLRLNGKRKTEAYLFMQGAAGWAPVRLDDGAVSDGKVETYERCVEAILGSAETFFTSVFSAQGKRQLTAYKNAEIKTLLADLLGLDEIRILGQKAAETARLLKAGLVAMRHEQAGLDDTARNVSAERARLIGAGMRVAGAAAARQVAQQALDAARATQTQLEAERHQAQQTELRRLELQTERQALAQSCRDAEQALAAQQQREQQRLIQLQQRIAGRAEQTRLHKRSLQEKCTSLENVLFGAATVRRAGRRQLLAERMVTLRTERVAQLRQKLQQMAELQNIEKMALQKLAAVEREAGQAALKAEELARRFKLTEEVPCAGTDLQGRCHLLGDASAAQALMPSARESIARLERQQCSLIDELAALRAQGMALATIPRQLDAAERQIAVARRRAARCAVLTARAGEIARARSALSGFNQELAAIKESGGDGETTEEFVERQQSASTCAAIAEQKKQQEAQAVSARQRIERAISALPAAFDEQRLLAADLAVERSVSAVAAAEQTHVSAVREAQALEMAERQSADLAARKASIAERVAKLEAVLGNWLLCARCLSNDGVIALAIDDAGPALSGLANDLLLTCYGARFTVSIKTLLETAKGEPREGFDIVVHDAESAESKSVGLMSGGERVWINECLVRAVALYLAQNAGRRYASLFSDEADGPLDSERKRMFMAMKREVLRLGAYEQEFFVSQSPELTAMADAVIDLEDFNAGKNASPRHARSR